MHDPAMGYQGGCWRVVKQLTAQASMAKAEHRSGQRTSSGSAAAGGPIATATW